MDTLHLLEQTAAHPRILVVGDVMLDKYTTGKATRISPEAPIPVLSAAECDLRPGGAANVASMCRALRAQVTLAGVVGDDGDGRTLLKVLGDMDVPTDAIVTDAMRCTTVKHRFVGGPTRAQQMLRVDWESGEPLDRRARDKLATSALSMCDHADVVLISDYGKGACYPELLRPLLRKAAYAGVPVLVDPGPSVDFGFYRQATLLKPNRLEAASASGTPIQSTDDASAAAQEICQNSGIPTVVITLDRDGMLLFTAGSAPRLYPATNREVCDVTGAGDEALATLGVLIGIGLPIDECVRISNIAAGLEVERSGATPITWEELLLAANGKSPPEKVLALEPLRSAVRQYKRQRRRVVFTNGCFDLLHVGHVTYLQEAARLGDVLVVGVNSDESVRRLKGGSRPIADQRSRSLMLAALSCVDHVIIFDADSPCDLLKILRPDVLVKGGTYRIEDVVGWEIVVAYGGEVRVVGRVDGVSTSRLIERIVASR